MIPSKAVILLEAIQEEMKKTNGNSKILSSKMGSISHQDQKKITQ